jgi:hypothetical protein
LNLARTVLGRPEPQRARADLVGGITAARFTFETEGLDMRAAGVAWQPPEPPLDCLLEGLAEDPGLRAFRNDDEFGFRWLTLAGGNLDDLAIAVGLVAEMFERASRWEQLVCAGFGFERPRRPPVFWIYSFASGSFHAFVPVGPGRRDAREELRLHRVAARDLRLEPDPQRWYALWEMPV